MPETTLNLPEIASREEWRAPREALLEWEKDRALGRQEAWEEPNGRATDPRDANPDFST